MKTSILTFSCLILVLSMGFISLSEKKENTAPQGAFSWEKTIHDFGSIQKGKAVSIEFKFQNTGNAALIISSAKGSCGCTVSTFTKEAIAPGKWGKVSVGYNAAYAGSFNKTVLVTSTEGIDPQTLVLRGEVVE